MKKKWQYFAVLSGTINALSHGMAFAWPSPSLPKLLSKCSAMQITNDQGSWLAVMPFFGNLLGAPVAAILADRCGRKFLILFTGIPMILSWLIIGLSKSYASLIAGRFVAGFAGGGLFTVMPSYIAEITEPKIRGALAGSFNWMWNLGFLVIYICGPFVTINNMAFISLSLPILFLLLFFWMPESPYYYMLRGKEENAKKVLRLLRGEEDVDHVIEEIKEELILTHNVLDIIKYPLNRKSLFFTLTLITIQECNGRGPFLFYSQKIFQDAGENIPAEYVSMIYGFTQLLSSIGASFIVDKFGRKPLLLFSCTGATLCLIIEGTYMFFKSYKQYNMETIKLLPVITLMFYIVIYTIGLGIVPMIFAGEIFATNVKSAGLCILDLYTALVYIGLAKYFQFTADNIGEYVPFWTYAGTGILGIIFIAKFLPETKGLSLEEIQRKLKT